MSKYTKRGRVELQTAEQDLENAKNLRETVERLDSEFTTLIQGLESALNGLGHRVFIMEETLNALVELTGVQSVLAVVKKNAREKHKKESLELFTIGMESGSIVPRTTVDDKSMIVAKLFDKDGAVVTDFLLVRYPQLSTLLESPPALLDAEVGVKIEAKDQQLFEIVGIYDVDDQKLASILNEPVVKAHNEDK